MKVDDYIMDSEGFPGRVLSFDEEQGTAEVEFFDPETGLVLDIEDSVNPFSDEYHVISQEEFFAAVENPPADAEEPDFGEEIDEDEDLNDPPENLDWSQIANSQDEPIRQGGTIMAIQESLVTVKEGLQEGFRLGVGSTGAQTMDNVVHQALSKFLGEKKPEFLDSELYRQVSPVVDTVLLELALNSGFASVLPPSIFKKAKLANSYMMRGATAKVTEQTLAPLIQAIIAQIAAVGEHLPDFGDPSPEETVIEAKRPAKK